MIDIEGWGAPEHMGLRREPWARAALARAADAAVALVLSLSRLWDRP